MLLTAFFFLALATGSMTLEVIAEEENAEILWHITTCTFVICAVLYFCASSLTDKLKD